MLVKLFTKYQSGYALQLKLKRFWRQLRSRSVFRNF